MRKIQIGTKALGSEYPPFVIAELSANHNGDIKLAKKLMETATDCGADAIKIQTYSADTMTIKSNKTDFFISHGLWKGRSLYDLYKKAQTPFEWQEELFNYARKKNITLFSTPFDESAAELLTNVGTPAFKISSFENTDIGLLKNVAARGKPVLVSSGMADKIEIKNAVETIRQSGCEDLLLFHCISAYPTPLASSKLGMIKMLSDEFNVLVGLSDHTLGNEAAIAAVMLGAVAVEKHFTLDRSAGGEDSSFSVEPKEFKKLVKTTKEVWRSMRDKSWTRTPSENENKQFRRSIYFVKSMKKGDRLSTDNIRKIRPGHGLPAEFFEDIIGRSVKRAVSAGDRVSWDLLD
tara:strand:+ start:608 stop:1654 length:1047 start_codon:yes stop_codon:yes gene_type:complete